MTWSRVLAVVPITKQLLLFLLLCVILLINRNGVDAAAVMSVDLGSEYMKVAVVTPGVPMEIVLNRESKRKTPAIIAYRDAIRSFGEDAQTAGIRDPASAYGYLLDLLGKSIDNPIVELYRKRFPYYDIISDPLRGTLIFRKNDHVQFTIEELIAQFLMKAKEYTETNTRQNVKEAVLTVPGYFGQAERQALLSAAKLANLKVLQLINDYTAVALNYGVFHPSGINETAQYYIFYDMGASHTSAALVSYQLTKDKQSSTLQPVVHVLGVGYDRTLGGLEIQLRLRDYLAKEFNGMHKTKQDVTKSPRALAKLFKEAGRVKSVLSANAEHYAQIENLIDEQDFKLLVTRDKLEEMCSDLWPRVLNPLTDALKRADISMNTITQVILFGGGTRVPKVQETIKNYIGQELGRSLNADEAAAIGAVYKAADLAKGFKVKKFVVKDAIIFPIHVSFEKEPRQDDETIGSGKGEATQSAKSHIKRVLFGLSNSYPQKKVITFNRRTEDFDFHVHYGDLIHLSDKERQFVGRTNITRVELKQIKALQEKIANETKAILEVQSTTGAGIGNSNGGIKAYFYMDESGIIHCTGIDLLYSKLKTKSNKDEDEESKGTLAKLGNTISKLFSKDTTTTTTESPNGEENGDVEEAEDQKKIIDDIKTKPSSNLNETDHLESGSTTNTSSSSDSFTSGKDNTSSEKIVGDTSGEKIQNETIKVVAMNEPVEHTIHVLYTIPLEGEEYRKSLDKLTTINLAEQRRDRLESSFNALESHIVEVQHKLEEEEYASCLTNEEKEKILKRCAELSEWLYEDGHSDEENKEPDPKIYEEKLEELHALTNVFLGRHWEHEERPEALKALDGMIDSARRFHEMAKNLTKDTNPEKDIFTDIELKTLHQLIEDTFLWQKTEVEAQSQLPRNADVRLTVQAISDKVNVLDREVKYLVNKISLWRPKPSSTKSKDKKDGSAGKGKKGTGNATDEVKPVREESENEVEEGQGSGDVNTSNNDKVKDTRESATPRTDL